MPQCISPQNSLTQQCYTLPVFFLFYIFNSQFGFMVSLSLPGNFFKFSVGAEFYKVAIQKSSTFISIICCIGAAAGVFPDADKVIIDREQNRHVAFGLGIHRCLGSNLARLELRIAVDVFINRFPKFALTDPSAVTWSLGQVRGPRKLPVRVVQRA